MITDKELAELIFPDIKETIDDLEKKYPPRNLKEGALVTRFAPSPTGFLHTGSLFTSMICHKFASQTGGVFFVRLEDTDTKREIEGSGKQLLDQLHTFNIAPFEGYFGDHEEGNYGPYQQSHRAYIYKVCIKYLISIGRAYPCFCSQEALDDIRSKQEANKIIPGYYGVFAKCRFLNNDEKAEKIKNGEKYVIRFKSSGNHIRKVKFYDLIRGTLDGVENDQDIVILKSDGLPTYHFAHAVDDHFMRTNTVIRGEEWISSLPIHVELFTTLGWKLPNYAHLPVIMKVDDTTGNKRKLSKRLDNEAAVSYFLKDGYPTEALIMYLYTIANSNFEEWIFAHNFSHMEEFNFSFEKFSREGALFDIGKLKFFSKEILARKTKYEILYLAKNYANEYDPELKELISRDENYFMDIMNIEREKEKPRKDYEKLSDLVSSISFFYDDKYDSIVKEPYNEKFSKEIIKETLLKVKENLSLDQDEQSWFNNLKEIASSLGYAGSGKEYKLESDKYIGSVSDVAEMLRITLTGKKNSPNLYYVMKVLSKDRCDKRIDKVIASL